MPLELKKKDYGLIFGGLITITVAGLVGHYIDVSAQVELPIDILAGLIILTSLGFVYKASNLLGGEIARNLQIMGAGALIYVLLYYPHIFWHMQVIPAPLSDSFGYVFYHGATALAFLVLGYGFYGFYQMGKE